MFHCTPKHSLNEYFNMSATFVIINRSNFFKNAVHVIRKTSIMLRDKQCFIEHSNFKENRSENVTSCGTS